jgi:hypothetical protein
VRAVPLQAIALDAIERQPPSQHSQLLFAAERGGYLDLRNFRNRQGKPAHAVEDAANDGKVAQVAAGQRLHRQLGRARTMMRMQKPVRISGRLPAGRLANLGPGP